MTELRIALLGGFRVSVGSRAVPDAAWHRRKPAGLIKLLALAPRHRLHREQAMDALWPSLEPEAAAANLRKALHHARRALGTPDGAALLVSNGDAIELAGDGVWVDLDAFRQLLARARAAADPAIYGQAVELCGDGGLLPEDAYEPWAEEARAEVSTEHVAALEEQAALLESRGDVEAAARALARIIAVDPLREDAHAWLIRLHALAGRRSDALRQYETLCRVLSEELGEEPSLDTQRLYEEVRARQPSEPALTAELWERVGDLRVVSGDTAGAARAFGAALDAGSPDAARLHRKLADAWLMQFDVEHAGPHLRAAEELVSDDAVERCRLLRLRATHAWQRGDLDVAASLAEEALSAAQSLDSADDLAAAHETVAIVSHMRGDWRAALLRGLDAAGRGSEQPARVFDIHHCIGQYHLYGDALRGDVEEYARRTLSVAEGAGAVRAQAFAWCLLGESLLLQARWDEAAGCLERSCELHASLGSRSGALAWQRLAEVAVCRGAVGDADALLRQASAIATVSPMARHLWGRIHATAALAALAQGAPDAAARSVRAAGAAAVRYGDCPSCSALLNPVAAETCAWLGDAAGASAYADAAVRVAGSFDSSAWRAMAESASAWAALAAGDAGRAKASFASAASLYAQAGQPFWAARASQSARAAGERPGNGAPPASAHLQEELEVAR